MWSGIRIFALAGAAFASCALALSARSVHLHTYQAAAGRSPSQRPAVDPPVPVYKVDPAWPKMPLRNKYLLQGIPTMVTDRNDHIWVLSRPRDIRPDENGAATTPPRADFP